MSRISLTHSGIHQAASTGSIGWSDNEFKVPSDGEPYSVDVSKQTHTQRFPISKADILRVKSIKCGWAEGQGPNGKIRTRIFTDDFIRVTFIGKEEREPIEEAIPMPGLIFAAKSAVSIGLRSAVHGDRHLTDLLAGEELRLCIIPGWESERWYLEREPGAGGKWYIIGDLDPDETVTVNGSSYDTPPGDSAVAPPAGSAGPFSETGDAEDGY